MKRRPAPAEFVAIDALRENVATRFAHGPIVPGQPMPDSDLPREHATTRFATFNVASGRSPRDGRVDIARFTEAIATLNADVLALQKVDRDQQRSGGADLTVLAAEAMDARHYVFAPTLYGTPGLRWQRADGRSRDGAAYGCALVSRMPLHNIRIIQIPALPVALPLWSPGPGLVLVREEPRVAIVADIDLGTRGLVTVVCTHLPFVPLWNGWQLRRLVRETAARADPLLMLGDLNLRGSTPTRLSGYTSLAAVPTYPSTRPRFQLDHVLLRGPLSGLGLVRSTSAPSLLVSDHLPLVVDIELSGTVS